MMHELIDREDPYCLYCNGRCDVALEGKFVPNSTSTYDIETLTCQECGEKFSIDSKQSVEGETTYLAFSFTCEKYNIILLYADFDPYTDETFGLYTLEGKHITTLPVFEVDFSDKKKLFEKLKTYVIFS